VVVFDKLEFLPLLVAFVDGGGRGFVSPERAVEIGLGSLVFGFDKEEFLPLLVALLFGAGGVAFTSGAFVEGFEMLGLEGFETLGDLLGVTTGVDLEEGFETLGDLLGVAAGVGLEEGFETLGDLLGATAGFDFGAEGLLTEGLREGVLLGLEGLAAGREEGLEALEEEPPPRLALCPYASFENEQTIRHESKTTNNLPRLFFLFVMFLPLAFI